MSYNIPGPNLSDIERSDLIEDYGGAVETQFAKDSFMREYADIKMIRGTDTAIERRMGKTTLKKLVPGVRPPADATPFGRVAVSVDTVIIARDNRSMLLDFQTDFDARAKLGEDHGKQMGKFFDEAFIIMAIKGAQQAAPDFGAGAEKNSIGAGKSVTLANAGDENDPDILEQAITDVLVAMEEEEVPVEDMVVLVRPTSYNTLSKNNKLVNKDYSSGNGDYAKGTIATIHDTRIRKTARIPTVENADHFLSNASNGNAYNVTAKDAKAVAVIMHPRSLLAGETIPLTSDVWFNKEEKQWFIDSWMAFGVSVRRPDLCGAVFKA